MPLPRDSSDIQVCFACPACNGNGGYGIRGDRPGSKQGNPFSPCSSCDGTGWFFKRPNELTATDLARLHKRLPGNAEPQLGASPPSNQ